MFCTQLFVQDFLYGIFCTALGNILCTAFYVWRFHFYSILYTATAFSLLDPLGSICCAGFLEQHLLYCMLFTSFSVQHTELLVQHLKVVQPQQNIKNSKLFYATMMFKCKRLVNASKVVQCWTMPTDLLDLSFFLFLFFSIYIYIYRWSTTYICFLFPCFVIHS